MSLAGKSRRVGPFTTGLCRPTLALRADPAIVLRAEGSRRIATAPQDMCSRHERKKVEMLFAHAAPLNALRPRSDRKHDLCFLRANGQLSQRISSERAGRKLNPIYVAQSMH